MVSVCVCVTHHILRVYDYIMYCHVRKCNIGLYVVFTYVCMHVCVCACMRVHCVCMYVLVHVHAYRQVHTHAPRACMP